MQIEKVRKILLNKYTITLLLFAVVFSFCGNQSVVNRVRMSHEIRAKERDLNNYKQQTKQAERQLRMLENPDSLERYAREHYYMREKDEDVYIIK